MNLVDYPIRLTHMWRADGGKMIVFSDSTFNLRRFEFNVLGGQVWELMDGQRSLSDLIQMICHFYPETDEDLIRSTILDFVAELEREWLIRSRREMEEYE